MIDLPDIDPEAFAGAIQSLDKGVGSALGIVDKLKGLFGDKGVPEEVRTLIVDLRNELLDAKEAQLALRERAFQFQTALHAHETAQKEQAKYELWKTPAGAFVYRLKDADQADPAASHYLCPRCFGEGRRVIMQPYTDYSVECPACDLRVNITSYIEPPGLGRDAGWG